MKQWIFFDLGSTLIDERETYHLFREHCLKVLCEAGHTLSLEEFEAKMIAFAKENKDPVKETWTFFAPSALSRPKWDHTTDILFQDVATVLGELSKSYHLGIIANQQENLAERLERFELGSYFGVVVGSADVGFSKPDLAIFEYALEKAGISPQEAIYVGDRIDNDMIPAKKLGMTTIWIRQGLGKHNQEYPAFPCDYMVEKVSDLLRIL